jgi:hypothetical protein
MPDFIPGIHVLRVMQVKDVDGRDEPGHDEWLILSERNLP